MGKSSSKNQSNNFHFDPNDWEQVSVSGKNQINNLGEPVCLRNKNNGDLVDAYYPAFLSEKDYDTYRQSLDFRKNQPNIVRALGYQPKVKRELCSTTYNIGVYLEHVNGRLSQYKDIPLTDSLYCMMAMLDGYKKLYDQVGRFFVTQDQVIIDEQGEVRVWLNSDLYKNQPQQADYQGQKWDEGEYDMVDDIISMIVENTDQTDGPRIKFGDYYGRQKIKYDNRVGFEQAKSIIHEYARSNNIFIPNAFESVLEIYQQNGGEEIYNEEQDLNMLRREDQDYHQYPLDDREIIHPVNSVVHPESTNFTRSNHYHSDIAGPVASHYAQHELNSHQNLPQSSRNREQQIYSPQKPVINNNVNSASFFQRYNQGQFQRQPMMNMPSGPRPVFISQPSHSHVQNKNQYLQPPQPIIRSQPPHIPSTAMHNTPLMPIGNMPPQQKQFIRSPQPQPNAFLNPQRPQPQPQLQQQNWNISQNKTNQINIHIPSKPNNIAYNQQPIPFANNINQNQSNLERHRPQMIPIPMQNNKQKISNNYQQHQQQKEEQINQVQIINQLNKYHEEQEQERQYQSDNQHGYSDSEHQDKKYGNSSQDEEENRVTEEEIQRKIQASIENDKKKGLNSQYQWKQSAENYIKDDDDYEIEKLNLDRDQEIQKQQRYQQENSDRYSAPKNNNSNKHSNHFSSASNQHSGYEQNQRKIQNSKQSSQYNYNQTNYIQTNQRNHSQYQQNAFIKSNHQQIYQTQTHGGQTHTINNNQRHGSAQNHSSRQRQDFYFTLNNEIQLDPEIAADLVLYA